MGSLQPAGEAALERASLLGASVTHVVFMNTTSIVPAQNRLLIDSTHYVVRDAQEWGGYTRALVEVARAQP